MKVKPFGQYIKRSRDLSLFSLILLIVLAVSSAIYYKTERNRILDTEYRELASSTRLKEKRLQDWKNQQISNAEAFSFSPLLDKALEKYLVSPDISVKQELINLCRIIRDYKGYINVLIAAGDGRIEISVNERLKYLDTAAFEQVRRMLASDHPMMGDILTCPISGRPYIDILSPIKNKTNKTIGVLILRIDPLMELPPQFQDDTIFENDVASILVHRHGSNLSLIEEDTSLIKLANFENMPMYKAMLKGAGEYRGIDFMKNKVVAHIEKIKGTDWRLISQTKYTDILAALRPYTILNISITFLLVLLVLAMTVFIYQYRQKLLYRDMLHAELAFKEERERFRTTLYSIGDGVITTDESGLVMHLNSVAEKLTGWKEGEARKKPVRDIFRIVDEQTKETILNPAEGASKDGALTALSNHVLLISRDGREMPVANSAAPIRNDEGLIIGFVLVFRDRSQEREAKMTLERSEARLRKAEGIAALGHWELHLETRTFFASANAKKIYGLKGNQWDFSMINEVPLPEYREMMDKALINLIERNEPYDIEFRIKNQSNNQIIDIHSVAEYDPAKKIVFGIIQDISEHKKYEREIIQREEQFRQLFDEGPVVKLIVDPDNGSIVNANVVAAEFYGYPVEKLCQMNIRDISTLPSPVQKEKMATMMTRKSTTTTFKHRLANEAIRDVEVFIGPIIRNGKTLLFAVIHDITERKLMELELMRSEYKYRELSNTIPVGIFETDATGQVVFGNKTALAWAGYSEDDLITGINFRQIVSNADLPKISEAFSRIMTDGHPSTNEYIVVRKDGATFPALFSSFALMKDGKPYGVRGTFIDLTDRVKAESMIREREERFRQIAESAGEWIWEVDAEGMFTYSSPMTQKILGYKPEEIIGKKHFYDLFEPDSREKMKEAAFEVFKKKESFVGFVNSNLHKNGQRVFLSTTGSPIIDERGNLQGYRGTDLDITERLKDEDLLRKLSRAVEQSPAIIMIADIHGSIEYVNPRFNELTGYSKEEILGQNPRILKTGHTTPEEYKEMWKTISSGNEWHGEFCNRKKNGELYWEVASLSPIFNDQGIITHYIGIKEDITEKKDTDRKTIHAIIQAEEQQRSKFSRDLHDGLGPMLSTVKLYFQWLAEAQENDDRMGIISKGKFSIDEAIQTLREISNNLSPRVLNNLGFVPALRNFIFQLNETGKLSIHFDSSTNQRFDKNLETTLYRITTELINNTLKHAQSSEVQVEFRLDQQNNTASLLYRDNGKGFSFNEVIKSNKGLGLMNIQQRVTSLNGKVVFETAPEKGLRVFIELPLKP